MEINKIYNESNLETIARMPDEFLDCVVTSPPYYGLRDYQVDGQIGLESTPTEYIAKLVEVFTEIRRVLKKSGTLWLNLGDSYASNWPCSRRSTIGAGSLKNGKRESRPPRIGWNLKDKDLMMMPHRVAIALQDSGWYVRQDIVWSKPNPMPESVTDRCTKSHEYIFLLTKSQKYYFDQDAIREPLKDASIARLAQNVADQIGSDRVPGKTNGTMKAVKFGGNNRCPDTRLQSGKDWIPRHKNLEYDGQQPNSFHISRANGEPDQIYMTANKRSVWTVSTRPFKEAHFATFPEELIVPMILAGCPEYCCANCSKPYTREVNKELVPTSKASYNSKPDARDFGADKNDQGSNRMKDGHKPGWAYKSETLGWSKQCECETAETKPGIVYDPFSGAGTTALVSHKLGRQWSGSELSEEYCEIANERLAPYLAQNSLF